MIFRRRRLPARLEASEQAFEELVPVLESAKAALTDAVPGSRLPGRPLAESLMAFEEGLRDVRGRMDAWRGPELERDWFAASKGLDDALSLAERVRTQSRDPSGFEGLIALVADLLEPLEAFSSAAERFRELRT